MKAITVRQPWAQAIIDGHKTVENRRLGFPHRYRGPVAIHAAQLFSLRGLEDRRINRVYAGDARPDQLCADLARGAIIGTVELVDAHPEQGGCCAPWGEAIYDDADGSHVTVHLVFEAPCKLAEPIPWKGALGLWNLPEDLRL